MAGAADDSATATTSRLSRSSAVTFRLTRAESFIRALIASQTVIFFLVCLATPDGSDGGGGGPGHVDVPRLIALLVELYLTASAIGLVIGYSSSRRRAVEVRLDGYTAGRRNVAWADVSEIGVKKTRLGGQVVLAGKRKLPAPISGPLGVNPHFDQDVETIRRYWDWDHAEEWQSLVPAPVAPRSDPDGRRQRGTQERAPIALTVVAVVVAVLAVGAVATLAFGATRHRSVALNADQRRYCRVYDDTTASLRSALEHPDSPKTSLAESIFAQRRDAAPTAQLRAAWSTWWSLFNMQSSSSPYEPALESAASKANAYAEGVCARPGDLF